MRECEETQDVCIQRSLATGKSPKWHTCEACTELKGHDSWSTIGQKVQSDLEVISQLKLVTHSSRKARMPYLDEN